MSRRPAVRVHSAAWFIVLLAAYVPAAAGPLDRSGTQWDPYLEWSLTNPTFEGNPFDLEASATFVHEGGETRTTGLFYVGGNVWKFRFTGTRAGRWRFTTSSADEDLDGRSGTVTIEARQGPGFVVPVNKNKWGRSGTGSAFVPQLVMYGRPDTFHEKPRKVDRDIRTFLVEHGFNGFHTRVGCAWFDLEKQTHREINVPNPDPRTFEALEMWITKVYRAGGVCHIWAWGDEQRKMTPKRWGINGAEDKRLQRYIAARLGPLPGWSMGYGFDLWEWVGEAQLREWHRFMHEQLGWPHMLGARASKNRLNQIYEGLDYSSYEQHRPGHAKYVETIDRRPHKPSFSEDRFRIRNSKRHRRKDYDMQRTRRGLWHSTLAGGVANVWGYLGPSEPHAGGSLPYPDPHPIKTYSLFFQRRFHADMVRDNALTDGVCLRRPTRRHYVFYAEDAASVRLDLARMDGPQKAIAVDTKKKYAEIEIGTLAPGDHSWTAPHASDWAIAVGSW